MIRPQTALAWLMALMLSLVFALSDVARAEEDVAKEDSPAAQAFRDAWWQETGAGALDRALAGYRDAVAAKGSDAVRAKALYRMGLVLQRMGKMDEALAALKRLATEFPGETALLERAKQRLDEWTAVDLREQFPEWYKRYQYSPEFQAKIVDLVLKLGIGDRKAQQEARQELLTIGEPAIPALEQHAGSANTVLGRYVVEILVELGRLPPAESALANTAWYRKSEFWKLLATADDATKQSYARAAAAASERKAWIAGWITATVQGPDAILARLRTDDTVSGSTLTAVLDPWFEKDAASASFMGALRAMVVDETVPPNARYNIAEGLKPSFDYESGKPHPYGLTPEEVERWARSDDALVRRTAWRAMASTYVHSQDALDAVSAHVLANQLQGQDREDASKAILGILRMRESIEGAEQAVEALKKLLTEDGLNKFSLYALGDWGPQGRGSPAIPGRALAVAIGATRGKHAQNLVYGYYGQRAALGTAEVQRQLLAWAASAADADVRRYAMQFAAKDATDDLDALTRPLLQDDTTTALVQAFFNGLNQANLQSLAWDPEIATRLVEAAARYLKRSIHKGRSTWTQAGVPLSVRMPYDHVAVRPFMRLLHEGPHVQAFLDGAVRFPERFDGSFWYLLGDQWKEVPAQRARLLAALKQGWARWSPDEREAGLEALLRETTVLVGDEPTETLLRGMLRSEGNSPGARSILLAYVSQLSLEDVRGSFDLAEPASVDRAAGLVARLPATREVYDAFASALRPQGPEYQPLYSRFRQHEDGALVRDLITRLLAHERQHANELAIDLLSKRSRAEDLPIWIGALGHRAASVRKLAAERLGRLYNDDAIKALAKAVDDPDPDVRDAVLASLAKIEKTEKEKDRWREFAKEGADK